MDVDDGEVFVGAAHDEGDGGVGSGDVLRLVGNDIDGGAELQIGGIVDGEGGGAVIDDEDGFVVWSDAGLDGLRAGFGAANDGAGGAIDGEELVGGGRGGEDAIVVGREIDERGEGPTGILAVT